VNRPLDEMVSLTVALGEQQNDDLKEKIRGQVMR